MLVLTGILACNIKLQVLDENNPTTETLTSSLQVNGCRCGSLKMTVAI